MALKDWKKTMFGWIYFKNRIETYPKITIYRNYNRWNVYIQKSSPIFGFEPDTDAKKFDTKSQAIRYAKQYMRKH